MRECDGDDLPPWIGERYVDVLAERAIRLLDDYAPEPHRTRSERVAGLELQRLRESARGPHDEI